MQIYKLFNHMGWTQSVDAARQNIDRLKEGFDNRVMSWKKNIEVIQSAMSAIFDLSKLLRIPNLKKERVN